MYPYSRDDTMQRRGGGGCYRAGFILLTHSLLSLSLVVCKSAHAHSQKRLSLCIFIQKRERDKGTWRTKSTSYCLV